MTANAVGSHDGRHSAERSNATARLLGWCQGRMFDGSDSVMLVCSANAASR